jgi:hypothetical protein
MRDVHNIRDWMHEADELKITIVFNMTGFERAASTQAMIRYEFTVGEETKVRVRVTYDRDGDYTFHMSAANEYFNVFRHDLGKPATVRIVDNPHGKDYIAHR